MSPKRSPAATNDGTTSNEQGTAHLQVTTDEQRAALAHARRLAEWGVPLFLARPARTFPHGEAGGYVLPKGWQRTVADPTVVDRWRPGIALCAVMGHVVDGLDVDPKNGGSLAALNGTMPRSYGRQETPSGGTHDLIASLGVRSRDGVYPGIDLKAGVAGQGHGFLFLAPTVKWSKTAGELRPYRWTTPPNLGALELIGGDGTGAALARRIDEMRAPAPAAGDSPLSEQRGAVSAEYVGATVAGVLRDLDALADLPEDARTDHGDGWDTGTFAAACALVRAANSGTDYTLDDAERDFREHAPTDGAFGAARLDHKWNQAVRKVGGEALAPRGTGSPEDDFGPVPREAVDRSTWAGVDLSGYLDGTHRPPVPRLLPRTDGVALLYPGLTHSIHGEPESGKSMVVQHEAARLLLAGEFVCYLDFESDPASIVERLLLLGATREAIAAGFVYLQPATDPDRHPADLEALLATLDAHPYALVVIDGVSESMDVVTGEGKDPNATAIEWARKVPRRIADRTGAAVVQIDHVTKNADTRGRFAIGGQAKLSALTGAAYSVDVLEPLGRGLRGELVLRVAKDRPGYVRGHSGEHRASDRTQEAARVVVDSTGDALVVAVVAPPARTTVDGVQTRLMERISRFLAELPEGHPGATGNLIRSSVQGKRDAITAALQALVEGGYVARTVKGQSHVHHLVAAFVPDFEEAVDA